MPAICVFCGSSAGVHPEYTTVAKALGKLIASSGSSLIFGGGKIGLMGILADEVLLHGGEVTGIIPDFLYSREVGHDGITSLEIVSSMHARKKRMADLSDVFIAIPGGWGTLDELAEILTWRQLGLIDQPVALLNAHSFFDPLLSQFRRMTEEGFLQNKNEQMLVVGETPEQLFKLLGIQ